YGVHSILEKQIAPLFLMELIVLVLGLSMLLSALNVRYRDVKYTLPFLTQIWLFVTPIIYPMTFLPSRYHELLALNPLAGIVEGFRASVLGSPAIDWGIVGTSWAVTLAVFAAGALYFRRTERVFADIV
ncbi:MAG: ABC transporter permease, partial [Steroidobacteraceae bacterium]